MSDMNVLTNYKAPLSPDPSLVGFTRWTSLTEYLAM